MIGQPYLGNFFGGTMLFGTLFAVYGRRNEEKEITNLKNPGMFWRAGVFDRLFSLFAPKPADSQIGFPNRSRKVQALFVH
nr:hypothetical protein [Bacillus licheniformis]